MNKKNIQHKRAGITLIEILLGLSLFAIFSGGIFYLSLESVQQNIRMELKDEGLAYAQEGIEALRSIRDRDYWSLEDGDYGLSFDGSAWTLGAAPESIDSFYDRTVSIESVYRDGNGDIAETGTLDPLVKKVTAVVSWQWRGFLPQSVSLSSYLSNWRGDQWMLTTCTEFNTGTYSTVEAQAASSPPPDNCVLTLSITESMGTFYNSVDVGDHGVDVAVSGNYAYLMTSKTNEGLAVSDISVPESAYVVAHKDINGKGRKVTQSGNYLYIGVESSSKGLAIVDVSTPAAPVIKSTTNIGAAGNESAIVGTTLYIGTESSTNSFHIYNVSSPTAPVKLKTLNLSTTVNAVQVSGSYAYLGTGSSSAGFKVVDVSTPSTASVVKTLNVGAKVRSIVINGTTAYLALDTTTNSIAVVDISNPLNPSVLSTLNFGAVVQDLGMAGNYLYAALDQVNPGLGVVNIVSPTAPYIAFTLDVGGKGTGVTSDGDYAYISLDTANAGLVLQGAANVGVASAGTYTSPAFDTGSTDTRYNYMDWSVTSATGGSVTLQLRTADSLANLSTATWVGPDGTAGTSYSTSPSAIVLSPTRTGQQYVQIQATLTSDGANSPGLDYFKLDYQP